MWTAVLGCRWLLAQLAVKFLPPGPEAYLLGIGRLHIGLGAQVDAALVAIDDDRVPVFGHGDRALHLPGNGNSHGACDDHDMARDRAFFQDKAAHPVTWIVEQLGRAHRPGNDNGVLRQGCRQHFRSMTHQLTQQPVGEIVEIAHPLAQIWIGHMQHARTHVALHLFHRGLGRQAVTHRLLEPPHPAAVICEHAVGFENGAVLAFEGNIAARKHVVDREAERTERQFEPPHLLVAVLIEEIGDDNARLVQHDVTKSDAFIEGKTRKTRWPAQVEFDARPCEARQIAGGDHLGDHHRRRFQRFELVLAIVPLGAVLDDENAQCAPCPQHRYAKERIVDFFARLRKVSESRVLLGIRQVERPRAGRDGADEALSEPQLRQVNRTGIQTFRRVEFEHRVGAQHIEGAHLRDHVLCDVAHDTVETLLRLQRLRHELAEPFQKHARSGGHVTHWLGLQRHSPRLHRSSEAGERRDRPSDSITTAYPDRRRNAKSELQVPYKDRRSGSKS